MSVRTLKLTIAYDGTDYAGWQIQASRKPTIQGTLQRVLGRILQEPVHVVGSGRTDAGVHALGQVAHVRIRRAIPCDKLRRALNSVLPPEIVVRRIEEVGPDFHARFFALRKRYRYQIVTGPVVLPFERRYVWHVRQPLQAHLMRREASVLRGRHDFRAFHGAGRAVRDTRRIVSDLRLSARNGRLTIEIEADGFLYTMVRSIVGTLVEIGRGHRPAGTMAKLLKRRERRLAGPTAPPHGLCLLDVRYSFGKN